MCCPSAANNKRSEKAWTEVGVTWEKEMVSLWFEVLLPDKFQILAANWGD